LVAKKQTKKIKKKKMKKKRRKKTREKFMNLSLPYLPLKEKKKKGQRKWLKK